MEFHSRSLIGSSPGMEAVREAIAQVAATEATVLILGETGTGKESIARSLHSLSQRRGKFVAVSGVALAPGLITSELFGHEAGAFTGAHQRRLGRFEQAQEGTLFLDEIGELPADVQALLLRVLQEREIERVGGGTVAIDVRVIAATHRDLPSEVKLNRFRADLFYRLNVFPIRVPPLRDRRDDIPALTAHFLELAQAKYQRPKLKVSASMLRLLVAHDWPGNIRELQNLIERATILSTDDALAFDPAWLAGSSTVETAKTWAAQERQRILDALRAADGRVYGPGGAAQRLGLNPTTLYGKMRKHGLARNGSSWQ